MVIQTVVPRVSLSGSLSRGFLLLAVQPWTSCITNWTLSFLSSKMGFIIAVPCGPVVSTIHINTPEMIQTGLANSRT